MVLTGNVTNMALLSSFRHNMEAIVAAFAETDFVELRPTSIIVHGSRADRG